jgi:hypothetical protein
MLVLASCHSLIGDVSDGGTLTGDPIEVAALKGIQWSYDPTTATAKPGDDRMLRNAHKHTIKQMQAAQCTVKTLRQGNFSEFFPLVEPTQQQKEACLKSWIEKVNLFDRKTIRLQRGIQVIIIANTQFDVVFPY